MVICPKWQPTPIFLPGESHGRRSLIGYSPRGRKELGTTEQLHSLTHSLCPQCLELLEINDSDFFPWIFNTIFKTMLFSSFDINASICLCSIHRHYLLTHYWHLVSSVILFLKKCLFWLPCVFVSALRLPPVAVSRSYSPAAVCRLPIAVACLAVKHRFWAHGLQ